MSTSNGGVDSRQQRIRHMIDWMTSLPGAPNPSQPAPLDLMRHGNLASLAPDPADATEAIGTEIDRLAENHALDEGNGAVMDVAIDSWVEQWHNDIDNEHDARQSELQQLEVEAAAELERRRTLLAIASNRYKAIDDELAVQTALGAGRQARERRRWRLFGPLRRRADRRVHAQAEARADQTLSPDPPVAPTAPDRPEETARAVPRRIPRPTEPQPTAAEDT